jgi:uncharacterized protein
MSADIVLHEYTDLEFPGAIALVGFPSIGLISSIAASFIVKNLKLDRVAGIISPDFPPYTLVFEGIPSPPVRIYAGERMCNEAGEQCEQLIVITAEFMPKPELVKPVADIILEWCRSKGIGTIITLEGMNTGVDPSEAKTLCIASGDRCKAMVDSYELEEMKEGMVSGISGVLLYEADRLGDEVMCLLGPAKANFPDARGAARLLEIIGKMLPELKLDPEPLYREAEEIEKQMRRAMEGVQQPPKPITDASSMIYG